MDDPTQGITQDVDVVMVHRDLARAPRFLLPSSYAMRGYREGDVASWVRIQQAADPFFVATAANFAKSMPGDTNYLATRVLFLVDPAGNDIGTITAWNGDSLNGRDIGQVHWVAIVASAQGRGLGKPMLSAACDALLRQGYTEAYLETNTARIPALNLYLQFGFYPFPRNEAERSAWRAIAPKLKFLIDI
jgi:GNAT superfamily N-acetyltransferase